MSNTIIPKLSSLVLPCFRLLCFGKVNFLLARSSFGFNKIFVHIYVSNPFMMSNFNSTLTSSMVYMCIFIMLFASFSSVESFHVDLKEQKLTVKGNVKPEVVLQTVSKTGKKTSGMPNLKPRRLLHDDDILLTSNLLPKKLDSFMLYDLLVCYVAELVSWDRLSTY